MFIFSMYFAMTTLCIEIFNSQRATQYYTEFCCYTTSSKQLIMMVINGYTVIRNDIPIAPVA